jgi:hypothetical protein
MLLRARSSVLQYHKVRNVGLSPKLRDVATQTTILQMLHILCISLQRAPASLSSTVAEYEKP